MKKIVVLGSTGSIGRSTLDVVRRRPDAFIVTGLSAGANLRTLQEQAREFDVDLVALNALSGRSPEGLQVLSGERAATELVAVTRPDIVVNGISGAAGFLPSWQAVRQGAVLALANKESLVIGGDFIIREAERNGARIVPVDSEHSAIFQCLAGERPEEVSRILLTASGGPFRTRPKESFSGITPEEALSHPTWSMGRGKHGGRALRHREPVRHIRRMRRVLLSEKGSIHHTSLPERAHIPGRSLRVGIHLGAISPGSDCLDISPCRLCRREDGPLHEQAGKGGLLSGGAGRMCLLGGQGHGRP